MKRKAKVLDPSTRFVRSLDGEYFMLREAAEYLGVSSVTLRSAMKDDTEKWGPSFCAWFGKVKIYLYTKADLERISKNLADRKRVFRNSEEYSATGRPKKWSDEENVRRQRLYSQHHYYRRRVVAMNEEGRGDAAAEAEVKVQSIQAQLDEQEAEKNKSCQT